ncbi:sad1 unc domain protein [Pyrenophora tritici-repentis]|nr:sad1 unc domain protein [Pyrenophora tritici-repentis]
MITTGAPLRNWTILLLLCSLPTAVLAEVANGTATDESSATAASGATTQHTSTPTPLTSSIRRYTDSETTSPYRTINYITHTLRQQCAKATWSAPHEAASTNGTIVERGIVRLQTPIPIREGPEGTIKEEEQPASPGTVSEPGATSSGTPSEEPELELETDSPFDNANFLSFEEWKKKNLAEVGQSPENVGQGRAAAANQPARRRPVNVNALDSLGDEGEISIDFSGFGSPEDGSVANSIQQGRHSAGATKAPEGEGKVAPSAWSLSKDAGKTCKERFNYASFDCAATVLKTNKQAKSSSSILVENKDSYMLNTCSSDNKFLIVELCDDILVDTVVLANYEFFSSMFRHFRVSVSDRYPVKMEKWRTLGTFEARNSRDIQPFLITEPQIWARYLRIEFLTQYGNEYYCPLSLLRVHGTTMMEQFRREEEGARGIDDDDDLEAEGVDVKKPAEDSGPLPPEEIPIEAIKGSSFDSGGSAVAQPVGHQATSQDTAVKSAPTIEPSSSSTSTAAMEASAGKVTDTPQTRSISDSPSESLPSPATGSSVGRDTNITAARETQSSDRHGPMSGGVDKPRVHSPMSEASSTQSPSVSRDDGSPVSLTNTAVSSSSNSAAKASTNNTVVSQQTQSPGRGSATQPNAPTPSTQESFFKSIHKRLQYLEANSTLSLQYIEEQSRALRDAFVKVEKRQLAKTEKFLDHLNSTVMLELKSFRTMYDQLWQSTVIELESMKERQKSEMGEIGTRLSLMADELVWQKRMAVVQSTLLLLCLGLVLFVRSGTLGSNADVPIVQQLGSKYTSFFESSPPRSPPESGMARRRRTFKSMWRSESEQDGQQAPSDTETEGLRSPGQTTYDPLTPDTPSNRHGRDFSPEINSVKAAPHPTQENMPPTPSFEDQAVRIQVLETQSGPATPNGTRDSRPSWEEVDRAMDLLKAEEQSQSPPRPKARDRGKKQKRSPLRRAQSNHESATDEEPPPP